MDWLLRRAQRAAAQGDPDKQAAFQRAKERSSTQPEVDFPRDVKGIPERLRQTRSELGRAVGGFEGEEANLGDTTGANCVRSRAIISDWYRIHGGEGANTAEEYVNDLVYQNHLAAQQAGQSGAADLSSLNPKEQELIWAVNHQTVCPRCAERADQHWQNTGALEDSPDYQEWLREDEPFSEPDYEDEDELEEPEEEEDYLDPWESKIPSDVAKLITDDPDIFNMEE